MSELLALLIYFRHIRIFGLASPELFLTFGIVLLFLKGTRIDYWKLFFAYSTLAFLVAVNIHYAFGVNTQLNYWLGLAKCPPNYNSVSGIFSC